MNTNTSDTTLHVVSIGAHPDDEISCAGTLINYARAGHKVTVVTMTRGGMGHMTMPTEELKALRSQEAEAAAKVIGADLRLLEFEDSAIPESREAALQMVEVIRELRPDIILTHGPEQRHPDHRATNRLVSDAYYLASLPLLETGHPWHGVKEIYFFDSGENASVYVDITESLDAKIEAAACHKSQYEDWLVVHDAGVDRGGLPDFRARMRDRGAALGYKCGVKYAEAFKPYWTPAPRAAKLLPLG
ncbi:MAG: PIG-L family deacetylase [Armatimonadaceae bacterium]